MAQLYTLLANNVYKLTTHIMKNIYPDLMVETNSILDIL